MEDHIRRHLLPARLVEPPGAQRRPQLKRGGLEGLGGGGRLPLLAARLSALLATEAYLARAAQDLGRLRRQRQPAMRRVGREDALRHQLPVDRQPTAAVEFAADAKRLQPVVAEAADPLGGVAEQYVDEVMGAEALAGAVHRRQRLLRRNRAVPALGRIAAIIAIAAGRVIGLAKIAEQDLPAAGYRLAIAGEVRVDLSGDRDAHPGVQDS